MGHTLRLCAHLCPFKIWFNMPPPPPFALSHAVNFCSLAPRLRPARRTDSTSATE